MACFLQTRAFYSTKYYYDIIYTSDSNYLFRSNTYLTLLNPENDLRQPLFAVFSAPFTGLPYFIARLLHVSVPLQAVLVNMAQVLMLLTANFMLAKAMKLKSTGRICFMLVSSSTYTFLLFVLMMEQYITAYFWLILCIYLLSEKRKLERLAFWGAGGSLLTSMILLPLMSDKNPFRNLKAWIGDLIQYGLEFILVLGIFARFDVIYSVFSKITALNSFAGGSLTFGEKFQQYTVFIANCFFAPDAGINPNMNGITSWQLNPVTALSAAGLIILILVAVSAFLNRKVISRLSDGWILYSALLLVIVGWGTKENGLILYSLYFGWPFLVLLFQLAERIGKMLKLKYFVPIISLCCTFCLLYVNIPAILQMIDFGIAYFPA